MTANPFEQEYPLEVHNAASIDLSAFDDDFAEAEAPDFDEVPDGKYQVRIDKAVLTHAQSSGNPMIKWDLVVISGPQEDRHIFKNAVITQKSLPFVKKDLLTLGLELSRISELPNRIPEVLDKTLEVTVKTKDEYRNCYFNRLLTTPNESSPNSNIPW